MPSSPKIHVDVLTSASYGDACSEGMERWAQQNPKAIRGDYITLTRGRLIEWADKYTLEHVIPCIEETTDGGATWEILFRRVFFLRVYGTHDEEPDRPHPLSSALLRRKTYKAMLELHAAMEGEVTYALLTRDESTRLRWRIVTPDRL